MTTLTNRRIVEPDALNAVMEFDHVVYSHGDGTVSDASTYGPEFLDAVDGCPAPWEPMTGYTGQYGYNGPHMHPSEYVGGALARDILDTPGLYVCVVVDYGPCTDDADRSAEPCAGCVSGSGCEDSVEGWAVLHDGTTPVEVPPSDDWGLGADVHVDALELGIDTAEGPDVYVDTDDTGAAWVTMTERTEWHAARWTDTWGTADRGPFDADGDLTADGLRFTRAQLRSLCPDTERHVSMSDWDTPAVEVTVELPAPVSRANVGALAYSVWARLANVTDPGTFGSEYLYARGAWDRWTEARANG